MGVNEAWTSGSEPMRGVMKEIKRERERGGGVGWRVARVEEGRERRKGRVEMRESERKINVGKEEHMGG